MDTSLTDSRCPKCGAPQPNDSPLGVCPACLLAVAAQSTSQLTDGVSGDLTEAISSGAYSAEPARFSPGDSCGSYRIVSLLGRGGMGEVYEAVGADGRRVALKLLRERLASQSDRERFLREGVLAASVTHRNCVYVYGSEEIDGLPVIVMELAPQGTLKHAVEQFGPRTPVQAVKDILQVIAGLEAAAASGILHRDVKPSNCFIDADGGIKVGDFGLSLSLNPADGDVTWKPTFQGTPEYASPEQLRGEPLDVRADIYSVGATLFCLLTGYSPFGERNIKKLVELKTALDLPTVDGYLPDIPSGLNALVGRCMSPDPNRRPQSYADLRAQFLPYVAPAPAPSSISRRAAAIVIDSFANRMIAPLLAAIQSLSGWEADRVISAVLSLAYFTLFERLIGATPGKLILGIRVTDMSGLRPTLAQAAARWTIALGPPLLMPVVIALGLLEAMDPVYQAMILAMPIFALCSVVYAHTRSDHAMLHDVWTATRVVRSHPQPIPAASQPDDREPTRPLSTTPVNVDRVGPFDVIGKISDTPGGDLLLGRDARLRRFVWIHRRPGAPGFLPTSRRQLALPTRLRWLAGGDEWDAFEAPDGRPFQSPGRQREWREISAWLVDLSRDLEAAEAVNAMPVLALDHLWVLASGRVMILDFRAPVAKHEPDQPDPSVPSFLARLMQTPTGSRPAPRSVVLVRDALVGEWMTTRTAGAILQKLAHQPFEFGRRRRAFAILACALPAAVFAAGSWIEKSTELSRFDRPDAALRLVLGQMSPQDTLAGSAEHRKLLRTFVAESFRADLAADPEFWNGPRGRSFSKDRPAIEHSVRWFTPTTSAEALAAGKEADTLLQSERNRHDYWQRTPVAARFEIVGMWLLLFFVPFAIFSVAISFVATPFLFRLTGLALEDSEGLDARLARRVFRAALTWSPLMLAPLSPWAALGLLAAGAAYAIASPERSIQDHIAGTFVAPR